MYVILAILIFGFLIFIHELGHFLVARMCGVHVLEFAIGMGPKILSKKSKKSGTVYSLRLFPLGGFVSMLGENGMEAVQGENGEEESILINHSPSEEKEDASEVSVEAAIEDPHSYSNQSVWKRILISVAGPAMNLLLGLVLMLIFVVASASQSPLGSNRVAAFYVTYSATEEHGGLKPGDYIVGIDNTPVQSFAQLREHVTNGDSTVFSLVIAREGEEGTLILNDVYLDAALLDSSFDYSRSEQCGLQVDDQILKVNKTAVHTQNELWYEVMNQGYRPFSLTVLRNGEKLVLENVIVPTFEDSGSVFGDVDFQVWAEKPMEGHETMPGVGVLLKHTWFRSVSTVKMVYDSLGGLFSGRFGVEAVSGPVGITQTISDVAKTGVLNILYLIIVISINLGIMNLLPVPGLDGGHLLIYFIEVIRRKPMKKELEGIINFVGLIILLTLAVLIAIKDIINL